MVVPWMKIFHLVLNNLDPIVGVVKPVFTRKAVGSLPSQADLLNRQIAELQTAASNNAEQIKALALQLKKVVGGLERAGLNEQAKPRKKRTRPKQVKSTERANQ